MLLYELSLWDYWFLHLTVSKLKSSLTCTWLYHKKSTCLSATTQVITTKVKHLANQYKCNLQITACDCNSAVQHSVNCGRPL